MRVVVTGHNGYIGSVMVPFLQKAGHDIVGLDTYLYEDCTFGDEVPDVPSLRMDLRDVDARRPSGLRRGHPPGGAVQRSAGQPESRARPTTSTTTRRSTWPRRPRRPACKRWLFASSCSLYGLAGDEMLTEEAGVQSDHPVRRVQDPRPSRTCGRWPTTASVRSSCATRRPTASRRGCVATSW